MGWLVEFDKPGDLLTDGTLYDLYWGETGQDNHCGIFRPQYLTEVKSVELENKMKAALDKLDNPPCDDDALTKRPRGRPKGSITSLDNQRRDICPVCDMDKEDFRCSCGKSSCYTCLAGYSWHCPHCDKDLTKLRDQLDPKSKKRVKKFEERVLK
jgi:hypothetical protein